MTRDTAPDLLDAFVLPPFDSIMDAMLGVYTRPRSLFDSSAGAYFDEALPKGRN